MMHMNEFVAVLAGIALAAACGFRVFVPLFIASLAANMGFDAVGGFDISEVLQTNNMEWLGSTPVTIALGVATVFEVGSYYIPWLDNALDSIATPAAVVAGTFLTGSMMPEFMGDGPLRWILAAIMGGGTAGIVQGASVITRGGSTATTGGLGNPLVSTAELGGALLTAALAIFIPILAGVLVLILLFFVIRIIVRYIRHRSLKTDGVGPVAEG